MLFGSQLHFVRTQKEGGVALSEQDCLNVDA
jgi:hypothetical protein